MVWLYSFIAIICWSVWTITQKMAVQHLSPMAVELWSMVTFAILMPILIGVAKVSGTSLAWSTPGVLWSAAGAALSTIACIAFLLAVQGSQVYVVTGITSTYPAFTLLFCWWFLGESVTWTRILGILVIVCGTILLQV